MSFLNVCVCGSADEPLMSVVLDRGRRGCDVRGPYYWRKKRFVAGERNTVHIHLCYLVSGIICTILHKRMET